MTLLLPQNTTRHILRLWLPRGCVVIVLRSATEQAATKPSVVASIVAYFLAAGLKSDQPSARRHPVGDAAGNARRTLAPCMLMGANLCACASHATPFWCVSCCCQSPLS